MFLKKPLRIVSVIVNSRFLQHPKGEVTGTSLLTCTYQKTKSIGSGSDPESQAGSQTAMADGVWSWDRREVGRRGWIRIGFVEERCFKFGVKELWRDSKRWGFGEFVGLVRYSEIWRHGHYIVGCDPMF